MKHKEILNVIKTIRESFDDSIKVYTQGRCYYFYLILKSIIPSAKAYYDSDHVITRIENKYYDITGEVKRNRHLLVDIHYNHKELNNGI